ncbi:TMEM175 family protein [Candidatus Parcubacteria bacterium]|nr:TMEM175 family protein [Candidatus Parcubacteria bacterium]
MNLSPARLEAFSDAVLAIIITISVLAIRIPSAPTLESILAIVPVFIVYAISFQMVGTYWNNHHHLLRAAKHISSGVMWSNLYLLFWLSIIPITTAWLGENYLSHLPAALYAFVLLMAALAYTLLQWQVLEHNENKDMVHEELKRRPKGIASLVCYILAVLAAFYNPLISYALIALVSLLWFIPDKRIEKFI